MAARKNKAPKTSSEEARAFVVVLEEIRAQNRVFGEGQQLLQHDITEIRHDITEIRGGGLVWRKVVYKHHIAADRALRKLATTSEVFRGASPYRYRQARRS
ncbi:MAG: hypothetical protein ABSE49_31805 [Polyangiaceae bacterium]|jgi:hypothetical protein